MPVLLEGAQKASTSPLPNWSVFRTLDGNLGILSRESIERWCRLNMIGFNKLELCVLGTV